MANPSIAQVVGLHQPSVSNLRARLDLDQGKGHLFWRKIEVRCSRDKGWNTRYAGTRAFMTPDAYGYLCGTINNRAQKAHRVILAMVHGEFPLAEVDHVNGIRSDNRVKNLRLATSSENKMNRPSSSGGTSQFKGVSWDRGSGKWIACCGVGGVMKYLGRYDAEQEAAIAYNVGASRLHGDFAVLNHLP